MLEFHRYVFLWYILANYSIHLWCVSFIVHLLRDMEFLVLWVLTFGSSFIQSAVDFVFQSMHSHSLSQSFTFESLLWGLSQWYNNVILHWNLPKSFSSWRIFGLRHMQTTLCSTHQLTLMAGMLLSWQKGLYVILRDCEMDNIGWKWEHKSLPFWCIVYFKWKWAQAWMGYLKTQLS